MVAVKKEPILCSNAHAKTDFLIYLFNMNFMFSARKKIQKADISPGRQLIKNVLQF